ncbi:MAG: alpha/beta hydrolase [Desulforhopalus sp.]
MLLQIFLYTFVGYLFCVLFMYLRQDSFLFFPTASQHRGHGYTNVEDYKLEREGATLQGWLVNPQFVRENLLIYYGGNGEDTFLNIEEFEDIQAASLFVAYRGYGPSSGRPGEAALYSDALKVIDDMVDRYSPGNIVLIGRSLGSGVACYVAARRAVQGAVLVTPYDSIVNVARSSYPWLPVSLLLKHRFDSLGQLAQISCPLLVIYGGRDRVIRPERTKNLINHIVSNKRVVCIEGADHGTIDMFPEYWQALLEFIHTREVE